LTLNRQQVCLRRSEKCLLSVTLTFDFKIYSFHHKHQVNKSRKFGEIQSSSYRVQKLILFTWSPYDLDLWSPNLFSSSVSQVDKSCKCGEIPSLYRWYCVYIENMVPLAAYRWAEA